MSYEVDYSFECEICGHRIPSTNPYERHKCPHCSQEYEHEEGQSIILTDEQKRILKAAIEKK